MFVEVVVFAILLVILVVVAYHYGFHFAVLLIVVLLFVYLVGRYQLRILVTVNMLVILFLAAEIALNVEELVEIEELAVSSFFVFFLLSLLMRDLHRLK